MFESRPKSGIFVGLGPHYDIVSLHLTFPYDSQLL